MVVVLLDFAGRILLPYHDDINLDHTYCRSPLIDLVDHEIVPLAVEVAAGGGPVVHAASVC